MENSRKLLLASYVEGGEPEKQKRVTGGILYDQKVAAKFASEKWLVDYYCLEDLPKSAKRMKFTVKRILLNRFGLGYDLLITDLGSSSLTLGLISSFRKRRIPTVLICHHFRSHLEKTFPKQLLYTFTEKKVVASSSILVANSLFTKERLMRMGRAESDIITAPPGISVKVRDKPVFRKKPGRLLLVGNIEERKGIIEAVKALHFSGVDAELRLVGERNFQPEYLQSLEECIVDLSMESRVQLPGRLSRHALEKEYELADAFILPSKWEGYGMAIAEAMASGLPVISTMAGAIPYLVEDGISGILLDPGDWKSTGKAINDIFSNPDLRSKLARGALTAAGCFPRWPDTTEKIYSGLTEKLH